nr:agamous-like MADS-box protein AGL104 [Ipomoea batatas]
MDLQQQLNIAEAKLRAFEPDIQKLASFNELEACQHRLVEALVRVRQRKETLASNYLSSNDNTMKKSYYTIGLEKKFYNVFKKVSGHKSISHLIVNLLVAKRGGQEVASGFIGLGDDSGEATVGEEGIVGATNSIRVVISGFIGKTSTNYKYISIIERI